MEYVKGKYKYFDELVDINNKFKYGYIIASNVRDVNYLGHIDTMLEYLHDFAMEYDDVDEFLFLTQQITGMIFMYQPFYDGNSRTMKVFLNEFLTRNGFCTEIDTSDASIIPLFYSDEETCTEEDINKLRKRVRYVGVMHKR